MVADRRITDAAQALNPIDALRQRADDYAPGDTDLAWTRITPWRTLVAGAFDTTEARVTDATVVAPRTDPTAALMVGWLTARLGHRAAVAGDRPSTPGCARSSWSCANGDRLVLTRENSMATVQRTGQDDRQLPLTRRPLGDELAEELRRLDADQIYAEALSAATGLTGLDERPVQRVHIWKDPTPQRRLAEPAGPQSNVPAKAPAGPGGSAT